MTDNKSFKAKILQAICENVSIPSLKEYVTFDPDMTDDRNVTPATGDIHVNGIDIPVRYEQDKDYKTYYFPKELGDYLLSKNHSQEEAAKELAEFMNDPNNEFGYILDKAPANSEDLLVINTSSYRPIKMRFGEILDQMKMIRYFQNHPAKVANEAVEDEDWMVLWQNSKNKKDDESYLDYLRRLHDSY